MELLEKSISNIVLSLKKRIASDIRVEGLSSNKTLNMVLKAYNEFQGNERNYVDYLYNIEDTGDVIECLRGGLTAKDIAHLYEESQNNTTKYFFFHLENHPTPEPIVWENLSELLIEELDAVLYAVIAYPWIDSYREIYTKYICNYMLNYLMVG